jgi:hypothetical protein
MSRRHSKTRAKRSTGAMLHSLGALNRPMKASLWISKRQPRVETPEPPVRASAGSKPIPTVVTINAGYPSASRRGNPSRPGCDPPYEPSGWVSTAGRTSRHPGMARPCSDSPRQSMLFAAACCEQCCNRTVSRTCSLSAWLANPLDYRRPCSHGNRPPPLRLLIAIPPDSYN